VNTPPPKGGGFALRLEAGLILRRLFNSITINADLSHLRYKGQKGIKALGRD
jgi:hypothetical protein